MREPPKRDWAKFWIHFLCGAFLGAVGGFVVWGRSDYASSTALMPGFVIIGGGALLIGVIAGVASNTGDHFWHSLSDWWRWR